MVSNLDLAAYQSVSGYLIGAGRIDNHSREFKFGSNDAVGTTEESVWAHGGRYVWPAAASTMTVSSTSANDAAAGSGAQTVQIYGLDENWLPQDEIVAMDGQTPVTTAGTYIRMFRALTRSAGALGGNDGDIYVGTGTVTVGVPANVYARILPSINQTLQAVWSIADGRKAYMTNFLVSSFGNQNTFATIRTRVRYFGEVFRATSEFIVTRGVVRMAFAIPGDIPPKSDVEVTAQADTGTIDVAASMEMLVAVPT